MEKTSFSFTQSFFGSVLFAQENYENSSMIDSINITNCKAAYSIIDIKTTSIDLKNVIFDGNINNGILSEDASLNLTNITIINHNCFENLQGCALYIFNTLTLIKYMEINLLASYVEGGTIFMEQTKSEISQLKLNNIKNFKKIGSCISAYEVEISINKSFFHQYDSNCFFGVKSNVSIDNCLFESYNDLNNANEFVGQYGAFFGLNIYVTILDSQFIGNLFALNGAAIFLRDDYETSSLKIISASIFMQNIAKEKGGAIFLKNQNLEVSNCSFVGNQAIEGGAIYLYTQGFIDNSKFSNLFLKITL
jgi:hypothetical protein